MMTREQAIEKAKKRCKVEGKDIVVEYVDYIRNMESPGYKTIRAELVVETNMDLCPALVCTPTSNRKSYRNAIVIEGANTPVEEYKIDVNLIPHPWDNKSEPYYWVLLCWHGKWCNEGCGWSKTPEDAWKQAYNFYKTYKE